MDAPIIKNAKIIFRPTQRLLETGALTEARGVNEFLEERYPGWQREFWSFYADQVGVDVLMHMAANNPAGIAALGILFCLMKEGKI